MWPPIRPDRTPLSFCVPAVCATDHALPEHPVVTIPRLSWPPPGLEPLQGVLWPLLRRFGFGAAMFAFPLLIAIATPQGFASLGPFGRSFWIPATLAFV